MRYIRDGGRWVPADEYRAPPVSGVAIHRDFSEPLLCHADNRMHGSKGSYNAAVRAAGCEVIGRAEGQRMAARLREPVSLRSPGPMLRDLANT